MRALVLLPALAACAPAPVQGTLLLTHRRTTTPSDDELRGAVSVRFVDVGAPEADAFEPFDPFAGLRRGACDVLDRTGFGWVGLPGPPPALAHPTTAPYSAMAAGPDWPILRPDAVGVTLREGPPVELAPFETCTVDAGCFLVSHRADVALEAWPWGTPVALDVAGEPVELDGADVVRLPGGEAEVVAPVPGAAPAWPLEVRWTPGAGDDVLLSVVSYASEGRATGEVICRLVDDGEEVVDADALGVPTPAGTEARVTLWRVRQQARRLAADVALTATAWSSHSVGTSDR